MVERFRSPVFSAYQQKTKIRKSLLLLLDPHLMNVLSCIFRVFFKSTESVWSCYQTRLDFFYCLSSRFASSVDAGEKRRQTYLCRANLICKHSKSKWITDHNGELNEGRKSSSLLAQLPNFLSCFPFISCLLRVLVKLLLTLPPFLSG